MDTPRAPRLLDQFADEIVRRGLSPRTVEAYTHWVRRYILYSGKRHPTELDASHVTAFRDRSAEPGGGLIVHADTWGHAARR